MEVRELESDFIGIGEVRGFRFIRIKQTEKAYLYLVKSEHGLWYEVFKRNVSPAHPKSKNKNPLVRYPNANSFGVWAWNCTSYARALQRFNQLTPNGLD